MCPYKGNLPPEYIIESVHQLIVYQVGKRSKIIMSNNLSLTTLNPDKVCLMCPYKGNVPAEYELVHQFIVYQEKEQNMSNNLSLTTLNPDKVWSNVSLQR